MPVNANILAQFAQPVRSVNDYMADYERQDANKLAGQRNALMLQGAQADMADRERTRAESETIRNVLASLGGGATVEKQAQALRATGLPTALSQAAAFEKSALERRNIESQAAEREAKTNAEKYGLKRKQLEHGVQWLQVAQSPQQAAQMFTDGVRKGYWGMQDAQQQVATIPQDPAQFQQWKQQQLAQILAAEKQLPTVQTRNTGGNTDTMAINPLTGVPTVTGSVRNTQSPDNAANNARMAADAAAARAQSASQFGQRLSFDRERAANPSPVKAGPMSVTLQKELLESDDAAQSSNAVISTLTQALGINKQAYSGYLAKPRATLMSNLPGQSEGADATINLDNMMTGQALESLKSTFGAAPTEGERRILMDMQASADKTPQQREEIINRAIAAAKRRGAYAAQKASAIRAGTYLTEGVPQQAAPAGNGPAVGAVVDGYKFKGGDPSKQSSWEKQ